MSCKWGHVDCINYNKNCERCFIEDHFYMPKKVTTKKFFISTKKTGRQGSISEVKSFNQMQSALNTCVTGTPNSGAGRVKGDEQIRGLINVMTEIKTTVKKNEGRQPGKESYSIQRQHLEKLHREAKAANMEFYFLKFSFKDIDDQFYCVTEDNQIIDMIVTMKHDREELIKVKNEFDVYKKKAILCEAENTKLLAEIDYLKAELKYLKDKDKEQL